MLPTQERSNLEPIDDSDMNPESKFAGGIQEKPVSNSENEQAAPQQEAPSVSEAKAERKEGNVEKETAYSRILSKIPSGASGSMNHNVSADAKETSDMVDYESRIEKLVNIAETKGVTHAVKVARHMEDNYLLDELHDKLLATDLHDALIRKGLIKEV